MTREYWWIRDEQAFDDNEHNVGVVSIDAENNVYYPGFNKTYKRSTLMKDGVNFLQVLEPPVMVNVAGLVINSDGGMGG